MKLQQHCVPHKLRTSQNQVRRAGLELEFAGLELRAVAEIVADTFDGCVLFESQAVCKVQTEDFGEFTIEVDNEFTKELALQRAEALKNAEGKDPDEDKLGEWLVGLTTQLVPVEVVCPPIPMNQLESLDPLVSDLREAGAQGTDASLFYAFGLHINVELPDLETHTIQTYLQAYGILQDWLIEKHSVDLVRRITPYIDVWPDEYIEKILRYSETVSLNQLINDYLQHNATRNRALDMLPLFAHLDADKISALDDPRINPRPAFHYRLPDCEIEKPGWSPAEAWNLWCVVEALVQQQALLEEFGREWLNSHKKLINISRPSWWEEIDNLQASLS